MSVSHPKRVAATPWITLALIAAAAAGATTGEAPSNSPESTADASPGDATRDPAQSAVRATLLRAGRVVEEEASQDDKLRALRELSRELFDTEAMAYRAMGDALVRQTEERQREFVELFDEFMVRAYLQRLLFFRKPRFSYAASEIVNGETIVHTHIRTPKDTFYVDYVMRNGGDRWRATDIVIEGMSLTSNYGNQFESRLRQESFDELLEKLRRKVEKRRNRGG